MATIANTEDNVIIEEQRDTELLYRSPGDFLCAAAPLIEDIPADFLACDTEDGDTNVHEW